MSDKKTDRKILRRAKTILSKTLELQDFERNNNTCLLPSSTEGFVQDLERLIYESEIIV